MNNMLELLQQDLEAHAIAWKEFKEKDGYSSEELELLQNRIDPIGKEALVAFGAFLFGCEAAIKEFSGETVKLDGNFLERCKKIGADLASSFNTALQKNIEISDILK